MGIISSIWDRDDGKKVTKIVTDKKSGKTTVTERDSVGTIVGKVVGTASVLLIIGAIINGSSSDRK